MATVIGDGAAAQVPVEVCVDCSGDVIPLILRAPPFGVIQVEAAVDNDPSLLSEVAAELAARYESCVHGYFPLSFADFCAAPRLRREPISLEAPRKRFSLLT